MIASNEALKALTNISYRGLTHLRYDDERIYVYHSMDFWDVLDSRCQLAFSHAFKVPVSSDTHLFQCIEILLL